MLKRLAPSIRKRTARLLWPNGRGVVRRHGVLYLINANSRNYYDKHLLQWGIQEKEQCLYIVQNIVQRRCDTFIDIGANYGLYAATVALRTGCGTIFAYEPGKRSYERLRANLLINDLTDRVHTRMVAVSNHNGAVQLTLGPDDNDFTARVGEEGSSGYSVPAVRLDDELPLSGQRIALKIDIEGHELAAHEGMKSLLRNNNCFLQVECWQDNAAPFIAAMKAEGYRSLHRIGDDHYFARGPESS